MATETTPSGIPVLGSLVKSAFQAAKDFEASLLGFVKSASDSRLPTEVIACAARASQIIQWNGQQGAVLEVLFDELGFVGCAIVQTGHNLEDSLYRAITDGRAEPKPFRTEPGYWSPDPVRSQFAWMTPGDASSPHGESGLGYGFWTNRQDASAKLIGLVATDASLSTVRNWRRIREILSIAQELEKRLTSDLLREQIGLASRRIQDHSKAQALLESRLVTALEAERRLAAAAAKSNQLVALVGLAAAVSSLVDGLAQSVDASAKSLIANAKSPESLASALASERQLIAQEISSMRTHLGTLLSEQNSALQLILQNAKAVGAPKIILRQPIWSENQGQPVLKFPKP